jgi:hypothetical protein
MWSRRRAIEHVRGTEDFGAQHGRSFEEGALRCGGGSAAWEGGPGALSSLSAVAALDLAAPVRRQSPQSTDAECVH